MPRSMHPDAASGPAAAAAAVHVLDSEEEQSGSDVQPARSARKRRRAIASSSGSDSEGGVGQPRGAAGSPFGLPAPSPPVAPVASASPPSSPEQAVQRRRKKRVTVVDEDEDGDMDGDGQPAGDEQKGGNRSGGQEDESMEEADSHVESRTRSRRKPRAAAAAASRTRGRARRRGSSDDDSDGEYKESDDEEEQEQEDDESAGVASRSGSASVASGSPKRYGTRRAMGAVPAKVSAETSTAMQRLLEDRRRAAAAAALAASNSSANPRRKRLFNHTGSASNGGGAAASSGVAPAEELAEHVRQDKYARAEAAIHRAADDVDEEDTETEQYFARIKHNYDPVAEARALEREQQREEDLSPTALQKQQAAEAERKWRSFQEREEKKKNTRTGLGTGTVKVGKDSKAAKGKGAQSRSAPKRRRPRAREDRDEDAQDYYDDDDFIADDEEVAREFEEAAESSSSEYNGPTFDEERHQMEVQLDTQRLLESTLSQPEAFEIWVRYLLCCVIDEGYSRAVDRNEAERLHVQAAQKVVEEQFNSKRDNWVYSATWDRADSSAMKVRIQTLAYSASGPPDTSHGCEVCNPKRGFAHNATHTLRFFGVSYEPSQLQHPFRRDRIINNDQYETHAYNVGSLCHQRLKLYHAMKHFKLHVMLALKAKLKQLCATRLGNDQTKPTSKRMAYQLVEELIQHEKKAVQRQFNTWVTLTTSYAEEYSRRDTRKTQVDLDVLSAFQNFEEEECLLELFDWRDVDAQSKYDIAPERVAAQQAERMSKSGGGKLRAHLDKEIGRRDRKLERGRGSRRNDDEYEVDLDAEAEAREAEERIVQVEAGEAPLVDDDDDFEIIEQAPGPAAAEPRSNGKAAAAAAAPPAPAASGTLTAWRRKGFPPSSAEEPVEDLTSEASAPAASSAVAHSQQQQAQQSSARKRTPTLPLSRVTATSPPQSGSNGSQQAAANGSSKGLSSPAGRLQSARAADSEALFDQFRSLSSDEQLNFLQLLGQSASSKQADVFVHATTAEVRTSMRHTLQDMHEHPSAKVPWFDLVAPKQ